MQRLIFPFIIIFGLISADIYNDARFTAFVIIMICVVFFLTCVFFILWVYLGLDKYITKQSLEGYKESHIKIERYALLLSFCTLVFYQMWIIAGLMAAIHFMTFWMVDDIEQFKREAK